MTHAVPVIAIVDDNLPVRRALGRLVQLAGFTAETFASAEDFLSSASLVRTACLVLDIHLNGGMSGFDLQARLAADGIAIPIIFITALDDIPTRSRASRLGSGVVGYLGKPFDERALLDIIRTVVGPPPPRDAERDR